MRHFAALTLMLFAGTPAFAQGKHVKTKDEATAVQALQQAQQAGDPDAIIKACDAIITKFADTEFKGYALGAEAEAYEQKGDHTKAIVFGEQALVADPGAFSTDTLLANIYANTTRDTDLDKEEKLTKAEKYAHDGITGVMAAPKPNAQISDADWATAQKSEQAQAYQALGTAALVRKKYDEAIANFQKGVDLNPDPVIMIRAGRAMMTAKKPDEAIVWFDKAAAAPNATDQIKTIAAADKTRAQAMKK
jgi:tetratricopeptide (TPR) repeat protein